MSTADMREHTPTATPEHKHGFSKRGLALAAMVGMAASLLSGCQSNHPNGTPTSGGPSLIATAPANPGTTTEQPTVPTTAPVQNPTTGNQATGNPNQGGNVTNNPTNLADFDATVIAAGYTPAPDQADIDKMGIGLQVMASNDWSIWIQDTRFGSRGDAYVTCHGTLGIAQYFAGNSSGNPWLTLQVPDDAGSMSETLAQCK